MIEGHPHVLCSIKNMSDTLPVNAAVFKAVLVFLVSDRDSIGSCMCHTFVFLAF